MSVNLFAAAQASNAKETLDDLFAADLPQEPEGTVFRDEDDEPAEVREPEVRAEVLAAEAPPAAPTETAPAAAREVHVAERDARIADRAAERVVREQVANDRIEDREAKARKRAEDSAKRLAEEALAEAKRETTDLDERTARMNIRAEALEADHAFAMDLAHEAALKAARSGDFADGYAAEQARAVEVDAYYAAREMKASAEDANREALARDVNVAEKAGQSVDRVAFDAARAAERQEQMEERNAHEAAVAAARKRTAEQVAAIKAGVDEPSVDDEAPAQGGDEPQENSAAAKLAALKAEMEQRRAQSPAAPIAQPAVGLDAEATAEALEEAIEKAEGDVDRIMSAAELGRARQAAAIARTEADLEEQAQQRTSEAARSASSADMKAAVERAQVEAKERAEQARLEVSKVVNDVSVRARANNEGLPTEEQLKTWVVEAAAKTREGAPVAGDGGDERAPLEMTPEAQRVLLAYLQSRAAAGQLRETLQQIDAEGGGYGQQQSVEEQLAPVVEDMRKLFQDLVPALVDGDADKLQGLEERIEAITRGLREENDAKRSDFGLGDTASAGTTSTAPERDAPAKAPSAGALDLVRGMIARSLAEGLPSSRAHEERLLDARAHEERLLEAGVSIRDEDPSMDEGDASKSKSIRPEAAWLLREYINLRFEMAAVIKALDAAGKAQPNMADEINRGRDAIMRRLDGLGVDVARAMDSPGDHETSQVQTSLARFKDGSARAIRDLTEGMSPEAVEAAASAAPAPAAPRGLEAAGAFQGSDADDLDDEIGLGGSGLIVNGDPEPPQPSRLAPSKAGDAFSTTPGDVIPPRPHTWPVVMAWPPHHYMQSLAAPDVTPEARQEVWRRLEARCDPMMERAAQIDEWIRSQRGTWSRRDRNRDDKFARSHSIGDPYRGVRWALLLENKPIDVQGVTLWGHSRAYLADGGQVTARHDGVRVRRLSDQAVTLAMKESMARGYGSLKISGTKEFCMKAAELARAHGVEAELTYGILGIRRKIKVMPAVPNPIVVHAGTEKEAKIPGTPEYEGRQAARKINAQDAEREAASRLPEPRPTSTQRRDEDLVERDAQDPRDPRNRREAPRQKIYADVEEGPNPFELG